MPYQRLVRAVSLGLALLYLTQPAMGDTVVLSQTFPGTSLPPGFTPANAIIKVGGGSLTLEGCLGLPGTYSRATGLRIEVDVSVSEYFWFSSFYHTAALCGQTTLTTGYTSGMLVTLPTSAGSFWMYREPGGGTSVFIGSANTNITSGQSYHATWEYLPDGTIHGYLNGILMFTGFDTTYTQGPLSMAAQKPASITKIVITTDLGPLVIAPIAGFMFSPPTPQTGETITFSDTSTNVPTAWLWDFGDHSSSTARNPTHSYSAPGTYGVSLRASNGAGVNTVTRAVTVQTALIAAFTFSQNPTAGTPVQFTDRSSGNPSSWSWDFGDHTASTASSPSHTFAVAGTYTIALTVSNGSVQDRATQTLQVSSGACTGNCLTLSGRATIKGSSVGIRGNGSPSRAVRFLDSAGKETQFIAPLGSDGRYSITLPSGTYTAVCDVNYIDNVDQATGGSTSTCRRAWQRRSLPGTAGTQQLDFAFPLPIVFLHGILSGPEKWDSWSAGLGAAGCDGTFPHDQGNGRADTIFFKPYYTDAQTYDNEALYVSLQLGTDFAIFSGTPPYNVIAHSKGGLVARVLHAISIVGDTIARAVLLGTPNDGSNCFSDGVSSGFHLSRCDLQALNSDAATGSWGNVDVLAIAGTKDALPLSYGWIFSACPLESGPDDGVVPVDSVFKITGVAGTPTAKVLSGFVVPYNHIELGSAASGWLMNGVVLPFLDGQGITLNGKPAACPLTPYSTPAVSCTTTRPSLKDYCYAGRGLTSDGHCTLAPRDRILFSAKVTWNPPGTFNDPPGSANAILTNVTGCGAPLSKGSYSVTSTLATGYQIYRSPHPITTLDPNSRIGYVSASEQSFYDPAPPVGDNFYAVTAVYDDRESAPALAPPLPVAGRQRSVRH